MRVRFIPLLPILVVVFAVGALALPPADTVRPSQNRATAVLDYDTYINANRILTFVTNYGTLFDDESAMFGRTDGFYYPFTTIDAIQSGQNNKTVVYSAGLWMGGKVTGQLRVAIAEFSSEYSPGPWHGAPWDANYTDPNLRVYKLYRDSLAAHPNTDYLNWPVSQGAPVTDSGTPAMLGDQMCWTVFSDADPLQHSNNAASTGPLGVEVRMTTWATSSASSTEGDAVYVKYLLYNRGGNWIDSFYLSFWVDPDLGDASDDLVGCDTLNDIFYCYNATNNDGRYGSMPPAWGGRVISGLVTPSPGSTAEFNGAPLPNYRNLPMTAFSRYINGIDPHSPPQIYNYMKGLTADGQPLPNGTKYDVPGDPVTSTGHLDVNPADRRLMASCGPITFMPGDSQQIVFKFAAQIGSDRLNSITRLRTALIGAGAVEQICDSGIVSCYDFGTLTDVRLYPAAPAWLQGYPWGRSFFNGGVTLGSNFFGSRFYFPDDADSLSTVEIRFSKTVTQKAYRYTYPDFEYDGYFDVPFTAWDVTTNRQVNVAFVEDPTSRTYNGSWNPDDSAHLGGREYLVVFRSAYSGNSPSINYTSKNLKTNAGSLDALYAGWFCLADGHSMAELDAPQKLIFESQMRNRIETGSTVQLPETRVDDTSFQKIQLGCISSGFGGYKIQLAGDPAFSIAPYNDPPAEMAWFRRVTSICEIANGSGPVNPPDGWPVRNTPNSTGEWSIYAPLLPNQEILNIFDLLGPDDYEIRFTGQSQAYSADGVLLNPPVPFEAWNIGATHDDPSDDWRTAIVVVDGNGDGNWDWGERFYCQDLPYGSPFQGLWDHGVLRIVFQQESGNSQYPAPGTIVRFVSEKATIPSPPNATPSDPVVALDEFGEPAIGSAYDPNAIIAGHYRIAFAPRSAGDFEAWLLVIDSATNVPLRAVTLLGSSSGVCCENITGNIDCDQSSTPDVGDLTALIDHLFVSFAPLCCEAEAECDSRSGVDIADLTALISHLFITFQPLPACP